MKNKNTLGKTLLVLYISYLLLIFLFNNLQLMAVLIKGSQPLASLLQMPFFIMIFYPLASLGFEGVLWFCIAAQCAILYFGGNKLKKFINHEV